ncbi:MAG: hypothetical protein LUG18_00055 [Candidatus Azobacteroides sp.]|nr:hypothetical protein [Candidatus Azobacteroides sp.]
MSSDEYIAATGGQTGFYFFYQMTDMNENSDTYGEVSEWKRDASRDGECEYDDTDYTPVFMNTNITTGTYNDFTIYGDRVLVSEIGEQAGEYVVLEYLNGEWSLPAGLSSLISEIYYPRVRFSPNGQLFITCSKGFLYQTTSGAFAWSIFKDSQDMAGGLGGSASHYFASAGANFQGIYKWNGNGGFEEIFENGCFYSIEALNENEVFFGSYFKSNSNTAPENRYTFGVLRFNGSSIVQTNLTQGSYSLTVFNNEMYAIGTENTIGIYKWNGQEFSLISEKIGQLKVEGGNLYLLSGNEILKFNGNDFSTFLDGSYSDIVLHEEILYVFSKNGAKYFKDNEWKDISDQKGTVGISSSAGLFVIGDKGIQKMVKQQ